MDGEHNGKPYEQMDDLEGFPIFLETPIYIYIITPFEPRKKPSYFPLYCLVNKDPYNGLL